MQRAPLPSAPDVSPAAPGAAPAAPSTPAPALPPPLALAQACERTDASLAELTSSSREAETKLRKRASTSGRFQPLKRSSG